MNKTTASWVRGVKSGINNHQAIGAVANQIRGQAGSDFSKALFTNYATGGGDMQLSGQAFAGILMFLKKNGVVPPSEAGSQVVSFYSSPEYDKAFGRATTRYNDKGQVIGFFDTYDFDSKAWGARSTENEVVTRLTNTFAPSRARSFNIKY